MQLTMLWINSVSNALVRVEAETYNELNGSLLIPKKCS